MRRSVEPKRPLYGSHTVTSSTHRVSLALCEPRKGTVLAGPVHSTPRKTACTQSRWRPDRGVIVLADTLATEAGEAVLTHDVTLMLARKGDWPDTVRRAP